MNLDKLFKDKRTVIILLALVAAGVILMTFDNTYIADEGNETQQLTQNNDTEKRLEDILSQVKGAGKVRVMITYRTGGEKIIAYNTDNESENNDDGYSHNEKSEIALSKDNPVILKENYPEIEGVLIVAQGGEDIQVKNNLISASMALLPVEVNKIEVLVMKKEA